MKRFFMFPMLVILSACQMNDPTDGVLSQEYFHKYGFSVSEDEWQERDGEGLVITKLANGVTLVRSFENGVLHGPTTYSFPHSDLVEKLMIYDQGTLLKQVLHHPSGAPLREEIYEFDDRMILTLWDQKGVPLCIEEYEKDQLINGKYYTVDHELESEVVSGTGERIQRDETGLLLSKEELVDGSLVTRTTYHSNGQTHTLSRYDQFQLHGKQLKYSSLGRPLMVAHWDHGTLHGTKIIYRNGYKIKEIPFVYGKKEGIETHFDDLGNMIAEICWQNDQKHGASKFYSEEETDTKWFYHGQAVSAEKFEYQMNREQMLAEFNAIEDPLTSENPSL